MSLTDDQLEAAYLSRDKLDNLAYLLNRFDEAAVAASVEQTDSADARYSTVRQAVTDLVDRLRDDLDAAWGAYQAADAGLQQTAAAADRLRAELAEAKRDAEQMRLLLAMVGQGVDPEGVYVGTPGWRLRRLRELEDAAKAWRVRLIGDREYLAMALDPVAFALATAVDALSTPEPASEQIDESSASEREILDALRERDEYHDIADQLAQRIAWLVGVDIGEHSSMNCPWTNAMEAADARLHTLRPSTPEPAPKPRCMGEAMRCTIDCEPLDLPTLEPAEERASGGVEGQHGYTGHGHPCCGQAKVGGRPGNVARCGGRKLCEQCSDDADEIHQGADTQRADQTGEERT